MNRRTNTPNPDQGDLISGEVPKFPTKDEVIAGAADMAVSGAFEQAALSHRQTDQSRAEGKEKQGEGETVQAIARGDIPANQTPQIDSATERWAQNRLDKARGKKVVKRKGRGGTIDDASAKAREELTKRDASYSPPVEDVDGTDIVTGFIPEK